jgi:putative ABC transport system permease protein
MAWEDLKANKFRTFLSLFGITIGIFCIIGVLSAINSLDRNIKKDLSTIGNNTIFISKWEWGGGGKDLPFWKVAARPAVSLLDYEMLQEKSKSSAFLSYTTSEQTTIEKDGNVLQPVNLYATTLDFINIQDVTIGQGRFMTPSEFESGTNSCVIGFENAIRLFRSTENALEQTIKIKGHEFKIIGVLKQYGRNILQGWDYDNCTVITYNYYDKNFKSRKTEPFIMAKAKPNIPIPAYISELRGTLRGIRKLNPMQEENFSLNDINIFSDKINDVTKYVQIAGSIIAFFSLIVGAFGIANIMFVTVKERTKIIGLKKAIGAKPLVIKMEFLLESAFLCILGGIIGLILLFFASILLTKVFHFKMEIRMVEILLTILLCTIIGILSGFIPANKAAKMNAVVAIRS